MELRRRLHLITTASPSALIYGSIDGWRRHLALNGKDLIDRVLQRAVHPQFPQAHRRNRCHRRKLHQEPKARSLDAQRTLDEVQARLQQQPGVVARLARELANRCAELTAVINALEKEIAQLVKQLAPALLALPGCGPLTAAKIIGETAGVNRFKSRDAYARYNGTAPLPVWSSNKARHRLSRTGNRQLNAALHRIALTQARWHPPAKTLIDRRKNSGNSGREAIRILKRRLSDAVFQALLHDQTDALMPAA